MGSLAAPAVALAALLLTPGLTPALGEEKGKEDKLDRPELDIRSTPRTGFSPLSVLFTLELKEGDDREDYYCPELEWEWGDGDRSIQESDCDPWIPGETKIARRYTNRHLYRFSGIYTVTVRLKRVDHTIARITHRVTIREGAGEQQYPRD